MPTDDSITKGERTRLQIMQAAYALFLEKGFNGTSIRQIADQAGIALGGIYNHFASKEEIFAAVFVERHPYLEVLPFLDAAYGDDIETILRDITQRIIAVLAERPDFLNLMFIEMIEFKGAHLPLLAEKAFPRLQNFIARITSLEGRDHLRPLPLAIILRAFLGFFISYAVSERIIGQLPAEFQVNNLEDYVDIFLHGILQPNATQAVQGTDNAAANATATAGRLT
jgi:AcrR family transcriptional regulator